MIETRRKDDFSASVFAHHVILSRLSSPLPFSSGGTKKNPCTTFEYCTFEFDAVRPEEIKLSLWKPCYRLRYERTNRASL